MGRNALFGVVIFLLLILGVCGFFLWRYANLNLAETPTQHFGQEDVSTQVQTQNNSGWMGELASIDKKDYALSANEIFIEYNKPKVQKSQITAYELIIDKNDIYSIFCLMQTLKNTFVDFTVIKDGVKSQIFLNTQDSKLLQNIILELKNYDIHSSVREVKL
ncbi:hypothetical protein CCAL9344_03145 [Campylobacter sp. RM9344]|uniref:Periplasmic protein n=1 Tax=Campylobacter californiensis TaxID=1032243 RepID=A0AAW3ZUW9_9BACT|nr:MULTISPECIES: hypothetical protein [unclassified Campylobacter]MBE2984748.1 hypothetical protein [Campylobacter sp. RM6883]MBE2994664.1 hypothetical protein [Campylobacter sp. RM6913]MBE3029190.1 hypothetical protein [Campylobacter sp. RM9344]MBE3605751.1 hypothetical protein [Campylobacter sp. RM13119]MBE3608394.1 hypothetical protein [Campylobacter sp. RM9337]